MNGERGARTHTGGRRMDDQRLAWALRMGLSPARARRDRLPDWLLHRLSRCLSDEARRLLLGTSERMSAEEAVAAQAEARD